MDYLKKVQNLKKKEKKTGGQNQEIQQWQDGGRNRTVTETKRLEMYTRALSVS